MAGSPRALRPLAAPSVASCRPRSSWAVFLTGTAAAAILAWNRYDESIKGVEKSLIGLGRSTQASASQLAGLAEGAAGAAGLSNVEARSGVGALAGTGRISADVMGDALAVGKDLAILTGQDLPDAMGDLASKLADPARGVEELDKQFNLFTVTQLKAIQRMAETGDRAGAQRAIVDRLTQVVGEASDKNSIWARSWDAVATAASNAVDAVGKAVDRAVSGPSLEDRLREVQQARRAIEERQNTASANRRRAIAQGPNGGVDPLAATRELEYNLQEEVRRQNQLAHQRAQQAQVQNLSRDMAAIYQGTQPVNDAITKLRQNIEALANAMAGGEFKLLPEDEQRRIREAAELLGRMNEAQSRYRAAGGESEYFGRRQAAFSVETSTMTDLERSIAEINEQYRVQVEQARASKESAEQLAAAEASLKQMRDDQLEALRRSTAMGVARGILPEMFERSQIEEQLRAFRSADPASLGLSADQAGAVIQRLEERLRNLKTPMEQLVEAYNLEQASIAATTFEQRAAVDSQKAYTEAINAGKSELQAAVEAVMAYNRAVAESQKAAYEAVRDAKEQAGMVGLNPYQREQRSIENDYARRRQQYGDQPGFDAAEGLEKWAARQEALRGPLEEANRSLNEQINSARVQADTFGKSTAAVEAAAEAQRLLNEYQRAGVPITAELTSAIQQHAQRYGEAQQTIEQMKNLQRNWTDLKGGAQDSLKSFFSDIREGKSLVDSLANAFDKLADKIWDMMLDSMFNPNSQGGFNIFQLLFGGGNQIKLPSLTSTGAATQGIATSMPQVGNFTPQAIGLSGGINQAIAGSAVPPFVSQHAEAAAKQVSSAIGGTFTKVTDGLRYEVEQYVRAGAQARGLDPGLPDGRPGHPERLHAGRRRRGAGRDRHRPDRSGGAPGGHRPHPGRDMARARSRPRTPSRCCSSTTTTASPRSEIDEFQGDVLEALVDALTDRQPPEHLPDGRRPRPGGLGRAPPVLERRRRGAGPVPHGRGRRRRHPRRPRGHRRPPDGDHPEQLGGQDRLVPPPLGHLRRRLRPGARASPPRSPPSPSPTARRPSGVAEYVIGGAPGGPTRPGREPDLADAADGAPGRRGDRRWWQPGRGRHRPGRRPAQHDAPDGHPAGGVGHVRAPLRRRRRLARRLPTRRRPPADGVARRRHGHLRRGEHHLRLHRAGRARIRSPRPAPRTWPPRTPTARRVGPRREAGGAVGWRAEPEADGDGAGRRRRQPPPHRHAAGLEVEAGLAQDLERLGSGDPLDAGVTVAVQQDDRPQPGPGRGPAPEQVERHRPPEVHVGRRSETQQLPGRAPEARGHGIRLDPPGVVDRHQFVAQQVPAGLRERRGEGALARAAGPRHHHGETSAGGGTAVDDGMGPGARRQHHLVELGRARDRPGDPRLARRRARRPLGRVQPGEGRDERLGGDGVGGLDGDGGAGHQEGAECQCRRRGRRLRAHSADPNRRSRWNGCGRGPDSGTLRSVLRVADGLDLVHLDGDAVGFIPSSGRVVRLNPAAAGIVAAVEAGFSWTEIVATLTDLGAGIDPDRTWADLLETGVLLDAPAGPAPRPRRGLRTGARLASLRRPVGTAATTVGFAVAAAGGQVSFRTDAPPVADRVAAAFPAGIVDHDSDELGWAVSAHVEPEPPGGGRGPRRLHELRASGAVVARTRSLDELVEWSVQSLALRLLAVTPTSVPLVGTLQTSRRRQPAVGRSHRRRPPHPGRRRPATRLGPPRLSCWSTGRPARRPRWPGPAPPSRIRARSC